MMKTNLIKGVGGFSILILILIYTAIAVLFFLNRNNSDFSYFLKLDTINTVSLFLFIIAMYISSLSLRNYSLMLIPMLLAFPASFNNLLPSISISSVIDYKIIFYPIITHIDIFIFFGILKYTDYKRITSKWSVIYFKRTIPYLIIVLLFIPSILMAFWKYDLTEATIVAANTFQLRYLALLFLLFYRTKIIYYSNNFFIGLQLSILFLISEAIMYTYVFETSRLTSGTLRVNTFANILSAVSCYYTFLLINKRIDSKYILIILGLLVAMYLTQTRSAVFFYVFYSIVIASFYYVFNKINYKKILIFITITILSVLFLYKLPTTDKFIVKDMTIEKIDLSKSQLSEIIVFKETPFNESLILRLQHYQTSINMIVDNPVFGIGPGLWNKHKNNYGSEDRFLLDSHNDFLAMASQYGLIQGVILCVLLYLTPLLIMRKYKPQKTKSDYLYIISFVMLFLGITNAGLFKHQVFGFLVLILVYCIFNNTNDLNFQEVKNKN